MLSQFTFHFSNQVADHGLQNRICAAESLNKTLPLRSQSFFFSRSLGAKLLLNVINVMTGSKRQNGVTKCISVISTAEKNFGDKGSVSFGPPHDKTNKMACAPSEDSDKPGRSIRPD